MQNFISTETSSQTAMACEQAALFGATPGPDEFDNREIWNEEEALAGMEEAIHILAGVVAPDGTQLADERESLLWGFVNTLHAQVQRLDRGIDKIAPEMKDLGQEQDGSEIKSRELERLTDRVRNLGDRRDAFEAMRDLAAEGYRAETGDTWRPRNGSHSSQTGKLTSAAIDARDYLRARKDRETSAHLPEGTLVAFTGGKDFDDVTAIWRSLDSIKIKYEEHGPCCTAADPARRRLRQAGRRSTACIRSCASRIGTGTARPRPSGVTTSCSTSCRRASSPSLAPASRTI